MARELAQDRNMRLQREAEAALEADRLFRLTVPTLMFRLKMLAAKVSVPTWLEITEQGFVMTFRFQSWDDELNTFKTEQWQAKHLERKLNEVLEEQELGVLRRELATEALAKLNPAELAALKEVGMIT